MAGTPKANDRSVPPRSSHEIGCFRSRAKFASLLFKFPDFPGVWLFGFRVVDATRNRSVQVRCHKPAVPGFFFPDSASLRAGFSELLGCFVLGGKIFVQDVSLWATACLLEFARVRGIRQVHRSKFGSRFALNFIGLGYQN